MITLDRNALRDCVKDAVREELQVFISKVGNMVEKPRDFDPFGHAGFAHLWLQYD